MGCGGEVGTSSQQLRGNACSGAGQGAIDRSEHVTESNGKRHDAMVQSTRAARVSGKWVYGTVSNGKQR